MHIRIGSRGSDLALWQAYYVRDLLQNQGHEVEIKIIKTQGDKIQHLSFDKMEGKGFFTKEIEAALLQNEIDLAVHSHKDLETTNPAGLIIAAIPARADVRDVLLIRPDRAEESAKLKLPEAAIVGTSSARRKAQIRHLRPDVVLSDLRGNVPTRVEKLRSGQYDAILLAKAGIDRLDLDLSDLLVLPLDPEIFLPAPAQGALALQIRESDEDLKEAMLAITNNAIAEAVEAERSILRSIDGGCQVPLGAHCTEADGEFRIRVAYATQWDGKLEHFEASDTSPKKAADAIISRLKDRR